MSDKDMTAPAEGPENVTELQESDTREERTEEEREERQSAADFFTVAAGQGTGDCVLVQDTPVGLLAVVCDGIGVHGALAASTGAQAIMDEMLKSSVDRDVPAALSHAMRVAHRAILDTTGDDGSGASVACLLLRTDRAVAAWLGDTRIYQIRGRSLEYRTTDHSKVMEMVDAGLLTEEGARASEEGNILTKTLGHGRDHQPRIAMLPYLKRDRFVICTSTLWHTQATRALAARMGAPKDVQTAVDILKTADDQSVVVIDTLAKSKIKTIMRTSYKVAFAILGILLLASVIFNIVLLNKQSTRTVVLQPVQNVDSLVEVRVAERMAAYTSDGVQNTLTDTTAATENQQQQTEEPQQETDETAKVVADTPVKRIAALEELVAGLSKTTDRAQRREIVDAGLKEIESLKDVCSTNTVACAFLSKAYDYLNARAYTVDGNPSDTRNQVGAINGQLRKARTAVE